MKAFAILLITALLGGCAATNSAPKYNALLRERTDMEQLRLIESARFPRLTVENMGIARAISPLSICSEGRCLNPVPGIIVHEGADKRTVTMNLTNASFAEIYEEMCRQTQSVWWVDSEVHVAPKSDL